MNNIKNYKFKNKIFNNYDLNYLKSITKEGISDEAWGFRNYEEEDYMRNNYPSYRRSSISL